ncbi:hypothetical protein [Ferroplasma sp.]|uniref:hypothetical protein n=1 Tax=Ferroplasma sp. TaxID=2591003 RepID=UPI0026083FB0|nr:hypothetical protein [Ferroplasma sp.]MCL4452475.1 hypothetical protein [Candidatus Thermoplasmatota archaeon]
MEFNNREKSHMKTIFLSLKIFWCPFKNLEYIHFMPNIFHSGAYYPGSIEMTGAKIPHAAWTIEK